MASSRKKQDEKNLKTIRELGALPQNKYCFDCNQRGPTYVNVTIGSFVCTKCSGILRGITPPHRVKSISMATFTTEEVDLLRSRGNEYCRRVWLGLYEGTPPTHSGDEQPVRDFMVEKYERRRYYMDPTISFSKNEVNRTRPIPQLSAEPKPVRLNGFTMPVTTQNTLRNRPEVNKNLHNDKINGADFVADFDKADIFSLGLNNGQTQTKNGFANFDNNPVFNNTNANAGMPTPTVLNNINMWNQQQNLLNGPQAPFEDKYAALKDLDNALKTQATFDWNSTGSNGSLYSSPTPTGSVYSSPSPQNSVFGSPSQGQFMSAFQTQENGTGSSNPFSNGSAGGNWPQTNGNGLQQQQQPFANPFHDPVRVNGFSQNFQPVAFPINQMPVNGTNAWAPNPFKMGTTASMNSSNPFL